MKIACPEGEISNLLSGYNCWCVDHPLSCISLSKRSFSLCVCTRHLVLDLSMYTNNYKSAYLNSCRGWLLAIICESVRQPKSLWGTLTKKLDQIHREPMPQFFLTTKRKIQLLPMDCQDGRHGLQGLHDGWVRGQTEILWDKDSGPSRSIQVAQLVHCIWHSLDLQLLQDMQKIVADADTIVQSFTRRWGLRS
jgi:hypothetical protein